LASAPPSTCRSRRRVPNIPVIDRRQLRAFKGRAKNLKRNACQVPREVCGRQAIDYEQQEPSPTEVGWRHRRRHRLPALLDREGPAPREVKGYGEYGYGRSGRHRRPQFERGLGRANGGKITAARDRKEPRRSSSAVRRIARPGQGHGKYCSKICCMYVAKHTML
jgi:heterodisulfide reductase subunit A